MVTDADETVSFGVPSKAFGKRSAVLPGLNFSKLPKEWWVITIHANSDNPVCYVLLPDEVRALPEQDKKGKAWWLEPKQYDAEAFRES